MNIAYIDICRILDLEQKRKHLIEYECPRCNCEQYFIWRSYDYGKCFSCDNETRLEDMKEELQAGFEKEHSTYKDMMENNKGVCY